MLSMIKVPYWLRNPIADRGDDMNHENGLLAIFDPFLLLISFRKLIDPQYDWWTKDPIRRYSTTGKLTNTCVLMWLITSIIRTVFAPLFWLMSCIAIFIVIGEMIVDNPIFIPLKPIIYLIGIISTVRIFFRFYNGLNPKRDSQADSFFKFYNSPDLRNGLLQDIRDKKINWEYPEKWKVKVRM
jgi:hypothetical protein